MNEPQSHWTVLIDRQPQKVFRRLPRDILQRIREAISGLAKDPWPPGCKKLAGYKNLHRLRVGDWRISYAVEQEQLIVLVLEVAPRGSAYRF